MKLNEINTTWIPIINEDYCKFIDRDTLDFYSLKDTIRKRENNTTKTDLNYGFSFQIDRFLIGSKDVWGNFRYFKGKKRFGFLTNKNDKYEEKLYDEFYIGIGKWRVKKSKDKLLLILIFKDYPKCELENHLLNKKKEVKYKIILLNHSRMRLILLKDD